ncbi:nucleotidyl transferase AbiEii/AbiGii toxin family protein [Streptomyces sp. KMM 9044]|uniref:nucleotidyl transferase AbiEii/AbiGii toxin family protein n=1 Tax=Streptomyces sp. KMM 9044 TaxID=2744474 RepID=UPI0021511B34|nr:nucleotidyl transferase AbiEii/AbiGii toxin family protein [Streptomyces sp. KMM 9044]WAX79264.1 nucleotidyl transferase AbiEii/AbiGii toxin family protein [Streptomyces sp. KMM 9044]
MNLSGLHRRLPPDVLTIGTPYPLVITGGYAVQAHGLVNRLSQDLDVATENPAPMADIAEQLRRALTERGWRVTVIGVDPLSARHLAADPDTAPDTGEDCAVDVLKENLWAAPLTTAYGPVLALDDVIGTKVRALADRGAVRDLIDVHAASAHHTVTVLERLGERHGRDEFRREDPSDRLAGAEWYDDEEFAAYDLTGEQITQLRTWARQWANDLDQRLGEDEDPQGT